MTKKLIVPANGAADSAALRNQVKKFPQLAEDISPPEWNRLTDKQKLDALRDSCAALLDVVYQLAAPTK